MVSSNFQESINWEKASKNKIKNHNNNFYFTFFGFFTQSSQYQIWKRNTYSILTNGNRICTASVGVLSKDFKVLWPTDSEHKLHKTRIENRLSIAFDLGSPWLGTYSHNHYTISTLQYDGSLKILYAHLQNLGTILETFHCPLTVQVLSKSIPSDQSSIKFQQKPTTICLIIYKHPTHTKFHNSTRFFVDLRERNSRNKK